MAVYRIESPDPQPGVINVRGVLVTDGVGYIPPSGGAIGAFTRMGWTLTELDPDDPQQPTLAPPEDQG